MATPEEWHQWRKEAEAAGNHADVAAIDAELAKLGGTADRPSDDWTPVLQMYADLKTAKAQGMSQETIDSIQGHIDDFGRQMDLAQKRREVEQMGPIERFGTGLGAGLKNVWMHAKDVGHELATGGGQETGWEAFNRNRAANAGGLPFSAPAPGEAEYQQRRLAEQEKFNQQNLPLQGTTSGLLGTIAGEAVGTAPIAAATGPAGTVLGSTLAGAGVGGLMAEPGQRLMGAAVGGGVGALTGMGQAATEFAARPGFEISPAAKKLKDLGVEGMTAGQMAPQSSVAQIEQIAENTPAGAVVKARRQVLPYNLEDRMIQEAHPPGFQSQLGPEASAFDRLNELKGEFSNRYNTLLDTQPVPKNAVQTDLLKGVYGPSKFALSPEQKRLATDIVVDQAAKLDDVNNMRTLHDIRSNLLAEQRLRAKTDPALAKHIGEMARIADQHIEDAMKADVNPNAYAEYQALGHAYRNYKVLEGAAQRDLAQGTTITPDSVSRSLHRAMTQGQFARGEGGTLRELAQAGKQVLAERPGTKTGASLNLLNAIPSVGPVDMGPWAIGLAGRFSSKHPELMLGQTMPQRVLQYSLASPAGGGMVNQGLRTAVLHFLRSRPGIQPEDENAP